MPYIVVKSNQKEVDRRELSAMLVFGRAPECDVAIRDIALSRRHCRIEACEDGWIVLDLGSKNGTTINGERLGAEPRLLSDGDVMRLGQSKIVFHAGLPDEDIAERLMSPGRPADPHEALAGTVCGFQMLEHGQTEVEEDQPLPQPHPKEPLALQRGELQELLTAIASSSWDSIYAEARQPAHQRPPRRDDGDDAPRRRISRPRSPIDLSLQASDGASEQPTADPGTEVLAITEASAPAADIVAPEPMPMKMDWRQHLKTWFPQSRQRMQRKLPFVAAGLWIFAAVWGVINWSSLTSGSTPARMDAAPMPLPAMNIRNVEAEPAAHVMPREVANPRPALISVATTQPGGVTIEPMMFDLEPADRLNLPGLLETRKPAIWMPVPLNQRSVETTIESLLRSAPIW